MCDTMVALGNSTKDGSVIFAKNSDRQTNEPHIMVKIPRQTHGKNTKVRCTYMEIDQAEATYEVLLLKPAWIWGCEMGCNEFGLNIGNEAVFTKEKYGEARLIGMDMVRIALERCRTSDEALDMIIGLLETYGQGGNCGYEKKFTYHNSFLIADKASAWVLETAGQYWAAEKVRDIRSISNCLTIRSIFDRCHPDLINHAVYKGWCKGEKDFNFARCYSNHLITKLSGAPERYKASSSILEAEKGTITVNTMKKILRHHEDKIEGKQFANSSLKSVCMHGGFIYGDHTTGSYIASLNDKLCTYWVTGSTTPCLSIFKPLWMVDGESLTFSNDDIESAIDYWRRREKLHRYVVENKINDIKDYIHKRDKLEESFENMVNSVYFSTPDNHALVQIIRDASNMEEDLLLKTLNSANNNPSKINGGLYFKYYWTRQNKKLKNQY